VAEPETPRTAVDRDQPSGQQEVCDLLSSAASGVHASAVPRPRKVEREQPDLRLHRAEDISRDVLAHAHDASRPQHRSWTFITSHAQVLLAVAHDPELRVEEIAEATRITERSAYRILSDLVEAGYLRRTRVGRRNRYELTRDLLLGDPLVEEDTVSDLLSLIRARERASAPAPPAS
jgi:DNA-binding transcriptional ArsR family regulator